MIVNHAIAKYREFRLKIRENGITSLSKTEREEYRQIRRIIQENIS
jgi:hypothetical protein